MSKGSRQRSTDRDRFSAGYDRIFGGDMDKYEKFTPNVPIERDSAGRDVQVVDGETRVLYPPHAELANDLRRQGMNDNDVRAWLDMV